MIITLYKNCRLNKSYCEVLDTIAPHTYNGVEYANSLEAYLSTLPKKVFNTGTGTIYGTNSGKIPFELAQGEGLTMYDYNYMKIADETNNFVRYCFILSLQVADGSAIAEYEEDVWASYSATMHVRKSLLTRSRSLKYGNYTIPFYKLGMEYEGNDTLNLLSIGTNADKEKDGKVLLIAQIQFYQLTTGVSGTATEKTNVITRTVMIYQISVPNIIFSVDTYLTKVITELKTYQSVGTFIFQSDYATEQNIDTTKTWYYEISNFLLLPEKYGLTLSGSSYATAMGKINISSIGLLIFADITRATTMYENNIVGLPIKTHTFNIAHNFKTIGIGTYSNLYPIVQNGTDISIDILLSFDDYNFNIFVSFQNQMYNITDNYNIDVPITVQSADVTQQARTARQLEQMNNVFGIGKGILNIYSGANSISSGVAETALGASTGQLGNLVAGSNMTASGVKEVYSGLTGIAKGIANMIVLYKPLYRTNKGTFSKSIGTANAYYGLFIYSINSDNDIEVQANIDNGGYVVSEVVDDLLQDMAVANDKPAYNVMQFDFVNNYGAFPEDVRQRLVDILTNGFKIWYNTTEYIAS